jgi:hypothetical protein
MRGRGDVESDIRFFRRRATEELAAANRAVTESARERRMILAGVFLERLKALESGTGVADGTAVFRWAKGPRARAE